MKKKDRYYYPAIFSYEEGQEIAVFFYGEIALMISHGSDDSFGRKPQIFFVEIAAKSRGIFHKVEHFREVDDAELVARLKKYLHHKRDNVFLTCNRQIQEKRGFLTVQLLVPLQKALALPIKSERATQKPTRSIC